MWENSPEVIGMAKAGMRRPDYKAGAAKIKQAKLRNEKAQKDAENKSGGGEQNKPL